MLSDPRRPRLLAIALLIGLLIAHGVVGARLLADGAAGQWGIDFADYYAAAERLTHGEVPYAPEMFSGPLDAQGLDRYRYPPLLAAWLMPLTVLPLDVAATVWFVAQLAALAGALYFVTVRAGVRGLVNRVLIAGLALAAFGPSFDALHKGNVSGFLAAVVAVAALSTPGRAVAAAMVGALVKLTPAALLLPLLLRRPVATLRNALLAALVFALPTLALSGAWVAYVQVFPNLLSGSANYASNLTLAQQLGIDAARTASLALGGGLLAIALIAGRTAGGRPAAMAAAVTASLLIPAALWWHYSVALLPLLLFALLRQTDIRWRIGLLVVAAPVAIGSSMLLNAVAIPALGILVTVALWPSNRSSHEQ